MEKLEQIDQTEPEQFIQIGPRIPKTLKKQLDKIALREERDIQDIVREVLTKYAVEHGEGNPVYGLHKWIENPEFKAVPALMTPLEKWSKFLDNCDMKTLKDLKDYASHVYFKSEQLLKK